MVRVNFNRIGNSMIMAASLAFVGCAAHATLKPSSAAATASNQQVDASTNEGTTARIQSIALTLTSH